MTGCTPKRGTLLLGIPGEATLCFILTVYRTTTLIPTPHPPPGNNDPCSAIRRGARVNEAEKETFISTLPSRKGLSGFD